jgi:uncharacterized protein YndB with AHSA1/START domain
MSTPYPFEFDPDLDLLLERTVDIPPEWVWQAWTQPELLMPWFCPKPWSVIDCDIDLRPGGRFRTVMQSPEGEAMPAGDGCYLEVVENRRLVWTSALKPGFKPADTPAEGEFLFTVFLMLEPAEQGGTRYTAVVVHQNEAGKAQHEAMGFHEGWGVALDQLVHFMKEHRRV